MYANTNRLTYTRLRHLYLPLACVSQCSLELEITLTKAVVFQVDVNNANIRVYARFPGMYLWEQLVFPRNASTSIQSELV